MNRFAIFVDAGYFFAGGISAAFDLSLHLTRRDVKIKNVPEMIASLIEVSAAAADGPPLLRAYWYDAKSSRRFSSDEYAIYTARSVKPRFGTINSYGVQKGVDSLIVTDMIELARNRAITDAVLVSGDEDLRIAVQIAQSYGVRVHILTCGQAEIENVSPKLRIEADSVQGLGTDWFVNHLEQRKPDEYDTPDDEERLQARTLLNKFLNSLTPEVGDSCQPVTANVRRLLYEELNKSMSVCSTGPKVSSASEIPPTPAVVAAAPQSARFVLPTTVQVEMKAPAGADQEPSQAAKDASMVPSPQPNSQEGSIATAKAKPGRRRVRLTIDPSAADRAALSSEGADAAARAIESFLLTLDDQQIARAVDHLRKFNNVVPELDRPIMATTAKALGGKKFTQPQMKVIRTMLVNSLKKSEQLLLQYDQQA